VPGSGGAWRSFFKLLVLIAGGGAVDYTPCAATLQVSDRERNAQNRMGVGWRLVHRP